MATTVVSVRNRAQTGSLMGPDMKSETKKRLRAMDNTEKERRLDELNQKLGITKLIKFSESYLEEIEEREWLKKNLGYKQR
ncbi:MAG TPA: hypothetical protein VNX60_15540 [Candidatus Acidoferrum sp.]|nr:hypothetical protein [Candidatus Acidoferrum sp.]